MPYEALCNRICKECDVDASTDTLQSVFDVDLDGTYVVLDVDNVDHEGKAGSKEVQLRQLVMGCHGEDYEVTPASNEERASPGWAASAKRMRFAHLGKTRTFGSDSVVAYSSESSECTQVKLMLLSEL